MSIKNDVISKNLIEKEDLMIISKEINNKFPVIKELNKYFDIKIQTKILL